MAREEFTSNKLAPKLAQQLKVMLPAPNPTDTTNTFGHVAFHDCSAVFHGLCSLCGSVVLLLAVSVQQPFRFYKLFCSDVVGMILGSAPALSHCCTAQVCSQPLHWSVQQLNGKRQAAAVYGSIAHSAMLCSDPFHVANTGAGA